MQSVPRLQRAGIVAQGKSAIVGISAQSLHRMPLLVLLQDLQRYRQWTDSRYWGWYGCIVAFGRQRSISGGCMNALQAYRCYRVTVVDDELWRLTDPLLALREYRIPRKDANSCE
jgi:hypothetical protein